MSSLTMGKKKAGKKAEDTAAQAPGPDDEVTVKCYLSERTLINKAAGARGQTVAELFRSVQVRTFLTHLIVEAGKEATQLLGEQEKPRE